MVKKSQRRISFFTVLVLILITVLISPQMFLFKTKLFLFSLMSRFSSPVHHQETYSTEKKQLRENERKMTVLLKEREQEIAALKKELSLYRNITSNPILKTWKTIPGNVIYYNPSLSESSILISCGSEDGVKNGAIVLEGTYILGKIIYVTKHTSKVLLLNDARSTFSVFVGKNRLAAIIKGQGKGRDLTVHFIDNQPENVVFQKDPVSTSGFTENVPSDILIGEISNDPSGDTKKYDSFLNIRVRPYVNVLAVKQVFVLSGNGGKK